MTLISFPDYALNLEANMVVISFKSGEFVGQNRQDMCSIPGNRKAGTVCFKSQLDAKLPILHAKPGLATLTTNIGQNLITRCIRACHVIILHDRNNRLSCLSHCLPSQTTRANIRQLILLFKKSGADIGFTTAHVIGGFTKDIGVSGYFLKRNSACFTGRINSNQSKLHRKSSSPP